MKREFLTPRLAIAVLTALLVSGCGMFDQTRPGQGREGKYMEGEYGDGAGAPVTVEFDGRPLAFQVWLSTKHPRVIVQAPPGTLAAMQGSVSRLSLGMIERPLDDAPYRDAALRHLAASGKQNCTLKLGGQVLADRFEWTYACSRS